MPIDLLAEPVGAAYAQLIAAAVSHCQSFSLIWRPGQAVDPAIGDALASHLLHEEMTSRWPGTELRGEETATLRLYQLTDFSASVLRRANRLYAWQHPAFPEDLAFYSAGRHLWLGSIAHEGDAWFDDSVSMALVRDVMPLLNVRAIRPASPTPSKER